MPLHCGDSSAKLGLKYLKIMWNTIPFKLLAKCVEEKSLIIFTDYKIMLVDVINY